MMEPFKEAPNKMDLRRTTFMKLTMERFTTKRLMKHSRKLNFWLAAALIIGQFASFIAIPNTARAQEVDPAALSADPSEEIVYIDNTGIIRVLDTQGDQPVQWYSPSGGWHQIVLMDADADGDMEILALRKGDGRYVIELFDPVVATGASDPNKQINGIPWDTLWSRELDGNAEYIVAGNFDDNIPGDEFAVGYMLGKTSIIEIWNAETLGPNGQPTGRNWKSHIRKEYPGYSYHYATSGQLNGRGTDEIVAFDETRGSSRMDIYQTDEDMRLLDSDTSSQDRFKMGTTGPIVNTDRDQLAVGLTVSRPARMSLRVYPVGTDGGLVKSDDNFWAFAPNPEWVFLADIRGNGDKEVFFIRNYPNDANGPRLIMRDEWGDDRRQNRGLIEWSLMDGGSRNEFRTGAGGDVDGDGRDEIILLRNDRIRVYHRPETGSESSSNFNDYFLPTDNERRNLLVGDLDRNGFTTGPILMVSGNMVDARVPAGTMSQESIISVTNVGTDGPVGINAIVPSGNAWVQITPVYATTPATFRVRFDATSLRPGSYSTTMTLRTNLGDVQNDNYVVYLNLTVLPPVLEPTPPMLSFYQLPCESNPCSDGEIENRNEPITTTIRVNGSSDLNFNATIIGVPTQSSGFASIASTSQLANIASSEVNEDGSIVLHDNLGNNQVIGGDIVRSAAVLTSTIGFTEKPSWIITATIDGGSVPSDITIVVDPSVLTEDYQREYALLILTADTRAGLPGQNMTVVPIELARVGDLLWITTISKK